MVMVAPGRPLPPPSPPPAPGFRFWIDEILWSQGRVAVDLMEAVLRAAGGTRTGGPPRRALPHGPVEDSPALGWRNVRKWDVLWTKSTYGFKAVQAGLVPGQVVSAVCGLNCLTMKKRMLCTLKAAYGEEGAWELTPVSFALPEELGAWQAWVRDHRDSNAQSLMQGVSHGKEEGPESTHKFGSRQGSKAAPPAQLWMLKTGQDAGKGLHLLPTQQALAAASQPPATGTKRKHSLQVAQLYCQNPMLLEGRKFHLRLWVVVTGHAPLRAYLHRRGLVLFSSHPYNPDQPFLDHLSPTDSAADNSTPCNSDCGGSGQHCGSSVVGGSSSFTGPPHLPPHARIAPGHITNLARNSSGLVWDLSQLKQRMGSGAYHALWSALHCSCAAALRAAKPSLQEANAWLQPAFPDYGFQLLGVDFLLDSDARPWLLELNSSPSIMTLHDDLDTAQLVADTKKAMVQDMVGLVAHRIQRPDPQQRQGGSGVGAQRPGGQGRAMKGGEPLHLGEFEPLNV